MRHVIVLRAAILLTALFLAAAGSFVWLTGRGAIPETPASQPPPRSPASAGAALFARHCASCHAADDLPAAPELEVFLKTHGESTDHEDRQIAEYLARGKR